MQLELTPLTRLFLHFENKEQKKEIERLHGILSDYLSFKGMPGYQLTEVLMYPEPLLFIKRHGLQEVCLSQPIIDGYAVEMGLFALWNSESGVDIYKRSLLELDINQ